MQALLARSVRFRHKRLAPPRCLQAEQLGITVDAELLAYYQRLADAIAPDALHAVVRRAAA